MSKPSIVRLQAQHRLSVALQLYVTFAVVAPRLTAALSAHHASVKRAWRHAVSFLRPRYETAERWLRREGRGGMR